MSELLRSAARRIERLVLGSRWTRAAGHVGRLLRRTAGGAGDTARGTPRATTDVVARVPVHARRAAHAGLTLSGLYAGAAGARPYRLYVPGDTARHRDGPPLLVMLHGCKQNPDDFAAGTRMNQHAEAAGWLVLWPAQTAAANASGCWNWFDGGHQRRDSGEPSLIAAMTREVMARHGVDSRRVYVAGLSAGGSLAATLAATHPDLYAACGVHSGLRHGAAHDMLSAVQAMRFGASMPATMRQAARAGPSGRGAARHVPTIVFHGDRDSVVHPRNADALLARADRHALPGSAVEHARAPGGRAYTRSVRRHGRGGCVDERWLVHGAGHAWSGGSAAGSFTDPQGPDASREMLRFFAEHPLPKPFARPLWPRRPRP